MNDYIPDVAVNGTLVVRPMLNECLIDGRRIKITLKEAETLAVLANKPGKIVSRYNIQRALWNEGNRREPPKCAERCVDVILCRLRKALKDTPVRIVNRWGQGWLLDVSDG